MNALRTAANTGVHEAAVFAALGDETRLGLVRAMSRSGPMSISRLTEGTGVTRQAITKHLEILRRAGLARDSKSGRERVWRIEPERLDATRRYLEQISEQWDRAIGRLRAMVEDEHV